MQRRRAVLASGAALLAGLAGCGNAGSPDSGNDGSTDTTGGENSLANHPAAANLDAQPRLGPDPADAKATILAFEDPSCPRCAAFERTTVPRIESELVEPGHAAFVFRGYPVIYPWGKPATKALEATYARSESAFWSLLGHYFEEQSAFDSGNVLSRTSSFLSSETDVEASGVAESVEAGEFDDEVQADLDAGQAGGVGRTTPVVLLFRDGTYRTKASGSVSFSLVKNALGL